MRVSWTPPPNPPSRGYLITTGDTRPTDFIIAHSTASSHDVRQQPSTVIYWLVALYGTPIVVGPVNGTVRGEEMRYNLKVIKLQGINDIANNVLHHHASVED